MNEESNISKSHNNENHQNDHHSSTSNEHRHHHRKPKPNSTKNALIITATLVVFAMIFVLIVRYFDRQDAEPPQLLPKNNTSTQEAAILMPMHQIELEINTKSNDQPVRWCALGDSITYGMYSIVDIDGKITSSVDNRESIGWTYQVAAKNGWSLTNLAFSNEGYLNPAADAFGTPGYQQARMTDFTSYNLVSISLGINDWLSNCPMGSMKDDPKAKTITTFIPAMRSTIEAIAESNPLCKIIVILPLNVKGFDHLLGTQDTNWAMEYEMSSSGTLKQFTDTMKEVCENYGIEYIDLSSASCLNSINLPQLLPDGIHPSVDAHSLLACELAAKIQFK